MITLNSRIWRSAEASDGLALAISVRAGDEDHPGKQGWIEAGRQGEQDQRSDVHRRLGSPLRPLPASSGRDDARLDLRHAATWSSWRDRPLYTQAGELVTERSVSE